MARKKKKTEDTYRITDVDLMAATIREAVWEENADELGYPHEQTAGYDCYLTIGQVKGLIARHARHVDGKMYLTNTSYSRIVNDVLLSIREAIFASLVARDEIEVSYDYGFTFVRKDEEEEA